MMIRVANVDAVVLGGEDWHACPKLGGEVEWCGAEHLPVEIEEPSAAGEKWLDPAAVKKIDFCVDGAPASAVGRHALATRPRVAFNLQWDYVGNIA